MTLPDKASADVFDFIVVGGGTAGLVIATRLAENPNVKVCVLEAGASRLGDSKVALPTGAGLMLCNPEYDWNYHSTPQHGTNDKVYHLPRGKMLGGSSGINFMAYGRPCKADIDDWSDKLGLSGWSWDRLLPYFKRCERLEFDQPNITKRNVNESPVELSVHGMDGAIHTSMCTWHVPFETALLPALDEATIRPRPDDPCDGSHVGFFRALFAVDRTDRPVRSYASGYLDTTARRGHLKIYTNTVVTRVIVETGPDGQLAANSVEVIHEDGTLGVIHAGKEVILSAGSLHTPAILERSGIGDPEVLERAQTRCVLENSNVGRNLQEHVMSAVVYELAEGITSLDTLSRDSAWLQEHQRMYMQEHSGALSGSVNLVGFLPYADLVSQETFQETIAAITSPDFVDDELPSQNVKFQKQQRDAIADRMQANAAADIQIVATPATFDVSRGYSNPAKLLAGARPGYNASYSLVVSQMYPLSRGSVHITSAAPTDMPAIDPGFLTDPVDVDVMATGLNFANAVFASEKLKGQVARRVEPPPEVDLQDLAQARRYVRDHIITYHHALGTCAMGKVVDERLRLMGSRNIRVIDASVIPMQVSAAIMATVYAVAEMAADMVKEDHRLDLKVD